MDARASAVRASARRENLKFEVGLMQAIQQAVIVTDLIGTIIYWNNFAEVLYGWSAAEAIGRSVGELLVPRSLEADGRQILARVRSGQSWSGEFVVRRRDQTRFTCQVTDSPLRDQSGTVVGVIGVSIDTDARKRAEEAQARLAAIVTSSEDAIIAKRLDGTITDWNRAAETLYGYTVDEIVGRSVSLLILPEQAAEAPELLARIAGGQTIERFDAMRLHKSGRRLDVSISITPIHDARAARSSAPPR
jgi:PAS domain S-box-containing protein